MTTYYVDGVNGNDSNNGLGPDATTGNTNKPFKTIGKLIAASGAMASGDTAYLAPNSVFRETLTVSLAPTAETKIIGDTKNEQGFKTSAGVRVAPGPVSWSAYTTNDKTAGTGTALITATSKNFYTWQNIFFVVAGGKYMNITTSHDWKLQDCAAVGPNGASFTTTFGQAMNITYDRCSLLMVGNANPLLFTAATGSGSDYDLNVRITNCSIYSLSANFGIVVTASGASAQFPGGVIARNCTFYGPAMDNSASIRNSTSITSGVFNSVIINNTGSVALKSGNSGSILEDYNIIYGQTRTLVTAGTHTIVDTYAPLFHFGQERIWGANNRPIGAPMSGSPWLGFGNDGSQTAYDLRNNPRPAGGASGSPGVGALERGNTWAQETGTVHSGSNAISNIGPGYHDFDLPVDASATTITIYMRYDSTYAGTRPQFSVLNGEECGVAAASVTATTAALNGWEQQSLTFTPARPGIVTVRVQSNDTNGGGKALADTFVVA